MRQRVRKAALTLQLGSHRQLPPLFTAHSFTMMNCGSGCVSNWTITPCGEDEIELTYLEPKDWRQAEALRDCEVTIVGKLFYSSTGYYSAAMAVTDPAVAPDVTCKPHPVKTDPTLAPKKPNIRTFVAEILVDYRNKGRVVVRVWEDRQRKSELTPWQAYIHYELTGLRDVMWFGCADGFEIRQIRQNPKPKNGLSQDDSSLAGTVLPSETLNTVSFACAQELSGGPPKQ